MKISFFLCALTFLLLIGSCNQSPKTKETKKTSNQPALRGQSGVQDDVSEKNILGIARASPDHTTLAAAIKAAGLEDVLTNAGPLTVFAPTNAAFDKLPEGTVNDLLKPGNKEKLAHIITYHAAPGSYNENNIKGVMGIGQATGDKLKVEVKDNITYVNGAKVIGTAKASNGYVHIIDAVLLPPPN